MSLFYRFSAAVLFFRLPDRGRRGLFHVFHDGFEDGEHIGGAVDAEFFGAAVRSDRIFSNARSKVLLVTDRFRLSTNNSPPFTA